MNVFQKIKNFFLPKKKVEKTASLQTPGGEVIPKLKAHQPGGYKPPRLKKSATQKMKMRDDIRMSPMPGRIKNNLIHYANRGIFPNEIQDHYKLVKDSHGTVYAKDPQGWRMIGQKGLNI